VIAATDYQGLGGGGRHQYSLANSNGKDALNSVRAAISMPETGAGKKAALYGWSQGGGAVLAVASMPEYVGQKGTAADGIEIVGVVGLAPYDNAAMVPHPPTTEAEAQKAMDAFIAMFSKTVFDFAHFSMALWAMEPAFPELKLNDIFTDEGVKALNAIYTNKCMHTAASTLDYNFGASYKSLLKAERSNTLGWINGIVKASNPPVKPIAPVVIYWGTGDVTNPPIMGKLYQEQMCKLGASVDRVQLPGVQTHFTTPGAAGPFYLDWVKDRFAGKPATNNCAVAAQLPIK
jgi:pimeloyl-ACP methyl ester carboxylesterase